MHLDWSTIALQTINFAILVWLLHRFLYHPVLRVIDVRKAEIQRQYDEAAAADAKARSYLADIEAQRAGLAAERDAALRTASARAQEAAEARRAQAEREAQAIVEAARASLVDERQRALDEARSVALDLGAGVARRLLDEVPVALRAEAWLERIEAYLRDLPAAERDALIAPVAPGGRLVVTTAAPLPADSEAAWRERLHRLLGTSTEIAFAANPALVAGADLHFPTAILRFSWQDALAALRSEMSAHDDAR